MEERKQQTLHNYWKYNKVMEAQKKNEIINYEEQQRILETFGHLGKQTNK